MKNLGSFDPKAVELFKVNFSENPKFSENTEPYNFADCADGEKMIFGACRKIGGSGEKDFDSSKKTKQETEIEKEGEKQKSSFENNKPFIKDGKKYGWAMKNGKKVAVEWGAIAGEKKVGPKKGKKKSEKSPEEQQAEERKKKVKGMTAEQREQYRSELMKVVEQSAKAKDALKELEDILKEGI
jgi:hypothetical protein